MSASVEPNHVPGFKADYRDFSLPAGPPWLSSRAPGNQPSWLTRPPKGRLLKRNRLTAHSGRLCRCHRVAPTGTDPLIGVKSMVRQENGYWHIVAPT
jgi:hypothetical protein